jgi:hypothetical protein
MSDALAEWLLTPVGQYASAYVKTCKVFPVHGVTGDLKCTCGNPDCKSAGKHPFTKHGVDDAASDIAQVAAMFHYRSDLNLAIRTGEVSDLFVLDVDGGKDGFKSLESLMITYGEFPKTVIVETGSGVHIYFSYPQGMNITNRAGFMPGLDIRGNGGYVVAPPSHHASGKYYKATAASSGSTTQAPDFLITMITARKAKTIKPLQKDMRGRGKSDFSKEEVQRMLDVLDPDVGYDDWLHIGMALHEGGFNLSLWDSWSRTGEKFENGDCEKRWGGFSAADGITMGTLVDMAQINGWKPLPVERPPVDTSSIAPIVEKAAKRLKKTKEIKEENTIIEFSKTVDGTLGFDPVKLPGLIGDTVRWIVRHAIFKQPELALLNTLAFAGAVFGRRYASPTDIRTNLYTAGIAQTAAGKDHSRKMITRMAHGAGLGHLIGGNSIRSDTGMLRGLVNNSSQIMQLDEFGLLLQSLSNKQAPAYVRAITRTLLSLYSDSNSIYNHGDYADPKSKPIVINSPNLCLYGTATESSYIPEMSKSTIEGGQLNRFVIVRAPDSSEDPARRIPEYEMNEDLKKAWGQWAPQTGDSIGVIVNNSDIAPEPVRVAWGECEDIFYNILLRQTAKTREREDTAPLWGRLLENTTKVAMLFAIARNKQAPEFEPNDFDLAQMLVEHSIAYLCEIAKNHMAESPQEMANQEIVLELRKNKGKMTRSALMRKFRKLKKRELDDILVSMVEQEVIQTLREDSDAQGRPKTIYALVA